MFMKKTIYIALIASISYFIVFIMLKFFLQNEVVDWKNALSGAVIFLFIIYIVHYFLRKMNEVPV